MTKPTGKGRGGKRTPGPGKTLGRPRKANKRIKVSATLAPGIQELAKLIAKKRGYRGQWYAVDEAVIKLAKGMGLIDN